MKSKIANIIIVSLVIGPLFILALLFASPLLNKLVIYQDVLNIEIPEGTVILNQQTYAIGSASGVYTYWLVLEGETQNLMKVVGKLQLKEENILSYDGVRYMTSERTIPWWTPPSIGTNSNYRLFQYARRFSNGAQEWRIQVELTSNKIYLVKVGRLKDLRECIKRRGGFYYLF